MTDTNNMRHWDALSRTDPAHTKRFQRAGGFKGTAMKPIWIVRHMTERFGPIGEGWGINKPEFQVIDMTRDTGKIAVYCTVGVWHTDNDHLFYGVGGDTVQDQFNNGKMVCDDEAFKKAFTDAVNNALKYIGVGGDIHMGQFEDSKYVDEVAAEFAPTPKCVEDVNDFVNQIPAMENLGDLKDLLDCFGEAIAEASTHDAALVQKAKQKYAAHKKALAAPA